MTGETIRGLLAPVIGKSGAVYLAVSNIGQVGFAINENSKLTGMEVRPDGLVRLERETGWTVIDPNEVRVVLRTAGRRAVLLQRLRLDAMRGSYWRALSGGQEQQLSIALALIGQPEAAVLDELTTGLDPEPRRETWGLIDGVRDSGVTIVLVTHFMEEAEGLCDRALIDQGKVVALGEPSHLAEQAATATRVRLRAPGQWMLQRGGRRRTSSSSSPSASISASTP